MNKIQNNEIISNETNLQIQPQKILSIVIPFYKEDERTLFPLLSTIFTQKGIDFNKIEILMVNDGYADYDINEAFTSIFYNLDIKILKMSENRGSGVARQYGLDRAVGKYVMFCDCDDLLHDVGILGAMIVEMENEQAEFLSTSWLEESKQITEDNTESYIFVPHEQEMTWLHGKMFLRQFLVDNDIRFHEELRVHEDTYFLSLVGELGENKRYLPVTSYIWNYSPNSITRIDNAIYSFNSMGVFCYAVIESIKELIKRDKLETITYKVVQLLAYIYLIAQSNMWQDDEAKPYLEEMETSLAENMEGLWEYWDNADDDFVAKVYWEEVIKAPRDIMEVSFFDWIENLG